MTCHSGPWTIGRGAATTCVGSPNDRLPGLLTADSGDDSDCSSLAARQKCAQAISSVSSCLKGKLCLYGYGVSLCPHGFRVIVGESVQVRLGQVHGGVVVIILGDTMELDVCAIVEEVIVIALCAPSLTLKKAIIECTHHDTQTETAKSSAASVW
eukprot:CAMPEP_0197451726 /NCGR_PEP_ID=MMETSP1175-20131217/29943_1 /TAXON_ID=1003142 /ORGANISM="Triceratium dubium, Strain CCMP147" /LENGTH=154 /DNA_ID=CAMNT_0042984547 /DNA_START=289 /DNA_END=751 /DNA_ORIENTATION=+